MESNKISTELQNIEKSLLTICQNTIKQTVRKQQESITEEFENTKAKLLANRNSSLIKLNVGGKKFTTLLSTLVSDPESNIAKMFSGALPIAKDNKDIYFIDRNGDYFAYVLDYLRDNSTELPRDTFLSKKINEEFEFFGITRKVPSKGPTQAWGWDLNKHSGITMSNDNKTVTKVSGTFGVAYGDTVFTSGIYRWKIIVTNVANSYWISAGLFSENEMPTPSSFCYTTCWGLSSYGNFYRMTGSGVNTKLVTGDVFEMEYNADTGEYHLRVPNRGIDIAATIPNTVKNVKPFAYVWTQADSLTLSFD